MTTVADPKVSQLFDKLQHATNDNDNKLSLTLANELLQVVPNDHIALQYKIVALIQLEEFDNALSFMTNKLGQHELDLDFEKIYCYYRTDRLDKALTLIDAAKKSKVDDPALQFVEAQILYSQEKYGNAVRVYEALLKKTSDPKQREEIQVNLLAAKACLAFDKPDQKDYDCKTDDQLKHANSQSSSYEMAYNAGSVYLAQGDLDSACEMLKKARDQYNDYDDEERAIIESQLAYVYQQQGHVTNATEIYEDILALGAQSTSLDTTIHTNLMCMQPTDKAIERVIEKIQGRKNLDTKLKRFQLRVLDDNEALLQSLNLIESKDAHSDSDTLEARRKGKSATVLRRKKRKPLLPKAYDPEKEPDAERWIPKYERAAYRAKSSSKKASNTGPQGAAVSEGGLGGTGSAKIEGHNSPPIIKTETIPTVQKVTSAPVQSKKKGKKKGKGK